MITLRFHFISLFFVLLLFGFCNNENSVAPVNYDQVLLIGKVIFPNNNARIDTVKNVQGAEITFKSADILIIRMDTTAWSYHAQTDTASIWQCYVKPNSYKICVVYFDLVQRKLITDSIFYNAVPTERIQVVPTIVSKDN
jgi:hypothetical protein